MNDTEKTKNRSGLWRILLVVSLAANLLVVGLVAGFVLRPDGEMRGGDKRQPPLRELGYGPFGQAFSADDKSEIRRALASRAGDLSQNRNEMRGQITSLLGLLRATPFDIDALRQVVTAQQSKLVERQEIGRVILLERIEAMSESERASFADRLEKSLRGPLRKK